MVFEAIRCVVELGVGSLVVDHGRPLGLFSERDYTCKVALEGRSSRETPVEEVVTRQLPVEEEGRLDGLVPIGGIVKDIIEKQ